MPSDKEGRNPQLPTPHELLNTKGIRATMEDINISQELKREFEQYLITIFGFRAECSIHFQKVITDLFIELGRHPTYEEVMPRLDNRHKAWFALETELLIFCNTEVKKHLKEKGIDTLDLVERAWETWYHKWK